MAIELSQLDTKSAAEFRAFQLGPEHIKATALKLMVAHQQSQAQSAQDRVLTVEAFPYVLDTTVAFIAEKPIDRVIETFREAEKVLPHMHEVMTDTTKTQALAAAEPGTVADLLTAIELFENPAQIAAVVSDPTIIISDEEIVRLRETLLHSGLDIMALSENATTVFSADEQHKGNDQTKTKKVKHKPRKRAGMQYKRYGNLPFQH